MVMNSKPSASPSIRLKKYNKKGGNVKRYKILVIWIILGVLLSCKAEVKEEEPTPIKKQDPILNISTRSQIKPLKQILQKKFGDDFGESNLNNTRTMWSFGNKLYMGFISFDIIPEQKEKIIISTINFTIYPEFRNNQEKFQKAWKEGLELTSLWIDYFSGKSLKFEDISPLYNSTLEQAQKNLKEHGFSLKVNTATIKN